jgi:hypothetical protein
MLKTNINFINLNKTMKIISNHHVRKEMYYDTKEDCKIYTDNYNEQISILDKNIIPKCNIELLIYINNNDILYNLYNKYKNYINNIYIRDIHYDENNLYNGKLQNFELYTDVL